MINREPDFGQRDPISSSKDNIVELAQERASQVSDKTRQGASEIMDQVRDQAGSRLAGQKDVAADGLDSVAHAVRQTGMQLRDQDQAAVAEYTDRAAEQIEHLSGYLRQHNLEDLASEGERFARRQPLFFLGGAFLAGFLGARFLRSSQPQIEPAAGRGYGQMGRMGPRLPSYPYGSGITNPPAGRMPNESRPGPVIPSTQGSTPGTSIGMGGTSSVGGSGIGTNRPPEKVEGSDAAA